MAQNVTKLNRDMTDPEKSRAATESRVIIFLHEDYIVRLPDQYGLPHKYADDPDRADE